MTETSHIGQYLKRERELRNIPFDYIVNATKITPRYLKAIEEGDFKALPGKIFLKGFIRSYAKCIGLSADDVLLRFEDSEKKEEPPVISQKVSRPRPGAIDMQIVKKSERATTAKKPISRLAVFIIVAALVLILAAIFSWR